MFFPSLSISSYLIFASGLYSHEHLRNVRNRCRFFFYYLQLERQACPPDSIAYEDVIAFYKEALAGLCDPDFSMYNFYSFLSENKVITYRKNELLGINVDDLIKTVNDNSADMVIFSNPCNPTGLGISADDARKLVRSVNALVVLDEAYMDFWDQSILTEASSYDNLIVLKTASKAVGCAAIRLGFAVANKTITNALRAVKSPYNVNSLSQRIGTCVYAHKDMLIERRDTIIRNTKELYKSILALKERYSLAFDIVEPCANFVFVRTELAKDIFTYLLENGIAVRFFGSAGALRITTGSEEENAEVLRCIEKYIIEKYLSEN